MKSQPLRGPFFEGTFFRGPIRYQFAIYYLPSPQHPPDAALQSLVDGEFKQWKLKKTESSEPHEMTISAQLVKDTNSYAPPSVGSLKYFGRGLSPEQAEAVQKTEAVFILDFLYAEEHVWDGLAAADQLTERLARDTGGLIWDVETRELFTPDVWHERRIAGAAGKTVVPDISRHTTIHAYQSDQLLRGITLGMKKFGLPDIVVDDFPRGDSRTIGILINLFGQAMAEGVTMEKSGVFTLDLKKIGNDAVREPQLNSLMNHATATAELVLRPGKWEDGDPRNRLVAIHFDRYDGPDVQARQEKLLGSFFGWSDTTSRVKPNERLRAASMKARAQLPKLQADFAAGLPPGETILVKAPFVTTDDGKEYMWVEISTWENGRIKGSLRSEPFHVPSLRAGQMVDVQERDVYDYIRRFPDGRMEGNETGKVIEAQQVYQETQ